MIKFPSIEQFRNVVRNVVHRAQYDGTAEDGAPKIDPTKPIPKIAFRGTVKLHGTNAGIVYDVNTKELSFQSRERVLTIDDDNAGFALSMSKKTEVLHQLFEEYLGIEYISGGVDIWKNKAPSKVVMFGEWCGGNIQSGVAINGLPKMFVIFAAKMVFPACEKHEEHSVWMDIDSIAEVESPDNDIHNVTKFGSWTETIDFADPSDIQNRLIEITTKVEEECPAGKFFGNSGVGEGVVWTPLSPAWNSSQYWFKVKGEKHSASKVKKLASVNVEEVAAISEFVEMAVTEARLEQGLQNLEREQKLPFEMTSIGAFIKWVHADVLKEETDTIIENQIEVKKLGAPIATKAKNWYITKLNSKF